VILFGVVGDGLLEYSLSHVRRGAMRAGKRMEDLYIVIATAFHLTRPGETLTYLQQAVGPLVTSECNIFALSVKDSNELPAEIRADLMAFKHRIAHLTRRSKRAISSCTGGTARILSPSTRR
jgi:hypothetical protein